MFDAESKCQGEDFHHLEIGFGIPRAAADWTGRIQFAAGSAGFR